MAETENIGGLNDYVPEGETLLSSYKVGWYTILTTKERIVLIKKFPKSFIEIRYDEVTSLEHLTNIRWSELIKGLLIVGAGYLLNNYVSGNDIVTPLKDLIIKYLPELASAVSVPQLVEFSVYGIFAYGLYHVLSFLPSFQGYFKISRKNRAPVMINTTLTNTVKNLVREIEAHKNEVEKRKDKPIVLQTSALAETASPEENIKKILEDGVAGLPDNAIIIATAKSKYHMKVVSSLISYLVNTKEMGGVYISVSRPYDYIQVAMSEAEVDSDQVFFVDCISQMAGKVGLKADNVVFVENPGSLEEVSMYLDRMLAKVTTEKKFLFLDSLSSLLIYNNEKSVKEFTHFIINKMRLERIAGVVLSTEKKEAEEMIKTLIPMCDTEIRF
ncbi:hypothetical protein ACFLRF_05420 [Candidatus Altiarchaeota archaeon]